MASTNRSAKRVAIIQDRNKKIAERKAAGLAAHEKKQTRRTKEEPSQQDDWADLLNEDMEE